MVQERDRCIGTKAQRTWNATVPKPGATVEECRSYGAGHAGVWGGVANNTVKPPAAEPQPDEQDRLVEAPAPEQPPRACRECRAEEVRAIGLCAQCYRRHRRRQAGAQPRQVGRRVAVCGDCGLVAEIYAKGRCGRCYWRLRRRAGGGAARP